MLLVRAIITIGRLQLQFWNFIKLFSTPTTTPAAFGGGLLGYVMYDVTHYYVHHGQPTSEFPKNLKVKNRLSVIYIIHIYMLFS